MTDARVSAIFRERGDWRLACADGRSFVAQTIVNATGAWADDIAAQAGVRAIGIEPRRRSAFVFDPPAGMDTRNWPAVVRVDESSYFKPDAGLLVGSPANADPVAPHDVVPEEIDIARGIDAIERYTTLTIRRPRRTWAGLRCFVADGEPVLGFDPVEPSFFWAAALGGYGIQSAPAVGRLCAALLRDEELPADLAALGVRLGRLRPDRARDAA